MIRRDILRLLHGYCDRLTIDRNKYVQGRILTYRGEFVVRTMDDKLALDTIGDEPWWREIMEDVALCYRGFEYTKGWGPYHTLIMSQDLRGIKEALEYVAGAKWTEPTFDLYPIYSSRNLYSCEATPSSCTAKFLSPTMEKWCRSINFTLDHCASVILVLRAVVDCELRLPHDQFDRLCSIVDKYDVDGKVGIRGWLAVAHIVTDVNELPKIVQAVDAL